MRALDLRPLWVKSGLSVSNTSHQLHCLPERIITNVAIKRRGANVLVPHELKALGITLPPSILLQADEMIE